MRFAADHLDYQTAHLGPCLSELFAKHMNFQLLEGLRQSAQVGIVIAVNIQYSVFNRQFRLGRVGFWRRRYADLFSHPRFLSGYDGSEKYGLNPDICFRDHHF